MNILLLTALKQQTLHYPRKHLMLWCLSSNFSMEKEISGVCNPSQVPQPTDIPSYIDKSVYTYKTNQYHNNVMRLRMPKAKLTVMGFEPTIF